MSQMEGNQNSQRVQNIETASDVSEKSQVSRLSQKLKAIRTTPMTPITPVTPSTPDEGLESFDWSESDASFFELAPGLTVEEENQALHERIILLKSKLQLFEQEQKATRVKGGLFKKSGNKIIAHKWKAAYSALQKSFNTTQKELLVVKGELNTCIKRAAELEASLKRSETRNKFFESETERLREKIKEYHTSVVTVREKDKLVLQISKLEDQSSNLEKQLQQLREENESLRNQVKTTLETSREEESQVHSKEIEKLRTQHKEELLQLKSENRQLQDTLSKVNLSNSQMQPNYNTSTPTKTDNLIQLKQNNESSIRIKMLENQIQIQNEEFDRERNAFLQEIEDKNKQIEELTTKFKNHQNLTGQLRIKEEQLLNYEMLIQNEKESSSVLLQEKEALSIENKELQEKLEELSQLPTNEKDQRKKIKELQEELSLQERMLMISKDLEHQRSLRIANLEGTLLELEKEKNAAERKLIELEGLKHECISSLNSDLSAQTASATKYHQMKMEMEIQLVDMSRINKSLTRQLEELQLETSETISNLKKKIEKQNEELHSYKKLQLALDEANTNIERLNRQLEEKKIQLKDIERLEKEISILNDSINSYEEENKMLKSKVRRLEEENHDQSSQLLSLRNSINEKTTQFEIELLNRTRDYSDLQFKYEQLIEEKNNEVKAKVTLINALNEVGNTTLNNSLSRSQIQEQSSPNPNLWHEKSLWNGSPSRMSPTFQQSFSSNLHENSDLQTRNLKVENQILDKTVQRLKTENKSLFADLHQTRMQFQELKQTAEQYQKKSEEDKSSEEDLLNTIEHLKQKINEQRDEYDHLLKFATSHLNEEQVVEWLTQSQNQGKSSLDLTRMRASHDELFSPKRHTDIDPTHGRNFQKFSISPLHSANLNSDRKLKYIEPDPLTNNSTRDKKSIHIASPSSKAPSTNTSTRGDSNNNGEMNQHIIAHESPVFLTTPSRYNNSASLKRFK